MTDLYDLEMGPAFWATLAVVAVIGIVAMIFFLLNLRALLDQVNPNNRAMQPNQVWLNFIPFFGLVWMIITVIKVRDSVRAEFSSRGWAPQGDFGFVWGMAYAILSIFSGLITALPLLICWVIYWAKTAELKKRLVSAQPPQGWVSTPYAPSDASYLVSGQAKRCPSCGSTVEPGRTFCTSCGESLNSKAQVEPLGEAAEPGVACPVCGVDNRPNAKFCRSCGRSFL